MLRLSSFWKWVIWYVVTITIFIVLWYVGEDGFAMKPYYKPILMMIVGVIVILSTLPLADDIKDIVAFKFRIVEEGRWTTEAQVLRPYWLFFCSWKAIDTKSHSYKTQNIFGAKERGYYETDVTYDSVKKAKKAIEKYKKEMKISRKCFFERPEKENKKITYL